jgi:hypothetical protein
MTNDRPFFAKSTFANIEILAVIGIFTLYALEFAGIHTFSQLLPDQGQTGTPALSFVSGSGQDVFISTGTITIMALVGLGVVVYFAYLRKKIKVRN